MVKFLKLVSGEEIIANVTDKEGRLLLKNPVRILLTPDGVGMAPLCFFTKKSDVEISSQHVIFEDEVDEEILNAYNAKYGSGIVLAGAMPTNGLPNFRVIE